MTQNPPDSATSVPVSATPPARPGRRWLWRIAQVVAGLLIGLLVTEALFWWRDDGAFPKVNLYVEDEQLGVRLEPGADQRFQLGDNPLTRIRINRHGYRGADFPKASENEILVVGDSQVFGLGVEEDETFSARLAELTGRVVINGGVPTYGPLEYTAVAEELMATRDITTVVYTINLVNDLFENERPNRDRHAVWDGWAVRAETAPSDVTWFPGRKWLFSRSHAVYALRRWLQDSGESTQQWGFASEGTWEDLVATGEQVADAHERSTHEARERNAREGKRMRRVYREIGQADVEAANIAYDVLPEMEWGDNSLRFHVGFISPGDILSGRYAESSRPLVYTARLIRQGVRYREKLTRKMRERAKRDPEARRFVAAEERRDALLAEYESLRARPLARAVVPSVLAPRIREIAAACAAHGAELVVLALPIDVQVSADEWLKYGVDEPIDMAPTRVLIDDLIHTSERLGLRALDTTESLAAVAEPAFLRGDIHMTPAGHRAVAGALADKLREPPPLLVPELSLPPGRTRIPEPGRWQMTVKQPIAGADGLGCGSKRVAEWLHVVCRPRGRRQIPSGAELRSGGRGEAMTLVTEDGASLLTPMFPGDEVRAMFYWTHEGRPLEISWPADQDAPTLSFGAPQADAGKARTISAEADTLCSCYNGVFGEQDCPTNARNRATGKCRVQCSSLAAAPSRECFASYGENRCRKLLECTRGELHVLPACPPGHANATATGRCLPLCSDHVPCATGTCTPWQGGHVCM